MATLIEQSQVKQSVIPANIANAKSNFIDNVSPNFHGEAHGKPQANTKILSGSIPRAPGFAEIAATDLKKLTCNDATFLHHFRYQPLIIRDYVDWIDCHDATPDVFEKRVRELIEVPQMSVYTGDLFINPTREEFITAYINDRYAWNLLEGLDPPASYDEEMKTPIQFSENWYAGLTKPQPLRSMVFSTKGSYTKHHTDPAGSGAWMYLLNGTKRWTIYDPRYRSALYSPRTRLWWDPQAPHEETRNLLPFCEAVPSFSIEQRAGDLIWVPPGWSHRVLTLKRAIGVGAFYFHPVMAVESVESMLGDASYHLPDAYLGHPNLLALEESPISSDYEKELVKTDYSIPGKEYHFVTVLESKWLPHLDDILVEYRVPIEEALRRLRIWQAHQQREAHVFPPDATCTKGEESLETNEITHLDTHETHRP